MVNLESSGVDAVVPVDPSSSKKKRKSKDGDKSSSKKSRQEGNVLRPIPSGLFDPVFDVGDQVDFCMSLSERAAVEPMSEVDITDDALEFTSCGAMLIWYLRQFADRRGAEDV